MTHLENFGNRIKQRRLSLDMTQTELAKLSGYTSRSSINKIELGLIDIPQSKIVAIAKALQCSPAYLVGAEETKETTIDLSTIKNIMPLPSKVLKMPIIGSISAGYNGYAQEEYLGEVEVLETAIRNYSPSECFVLRVKGNSMYPDYRDNDLVMVHKQEHVDSGATAVVLYNGDEATLKQVKYVQGEDWVDLIPRNPEYETKRIKGDDLQYCRVIGKVLSLVLRQEN